MAPVAEIANQKRSQPGFHLARYRSPAILALLHPEFGGQFLSGCG